ncbi:hypothetical protein NESM_000858400 [Novymonas esmeraldas]|uniref:Uncharacterized protein n=1 Tax=Novymonas esmeraldas TaxID=1808958 RepID=A0AAW0EZB6_9TRYP
MPVAYALAKECQVLRSDVEGVLSLAAQLLTHTTAAPVSDGAAAAAAPTPASSSTAATSTVGPVVGALLTDAHARALLINTLVRVLVPARRQSALLDSNRYVQAANVAARQEQQQQQQQQQQQSATGAKAASPTNGVAVDVSQRYRVGRIVGVVPKAAARSTETRQAGALGVGGAAAAAEEAQRWLLAVYVGECVEPAAVSAIADEPFTEVEHRIFVQSALSTTAGDGGRRAVVLPSLQPAVLSAEAAAAVQHTIRDIRLAVRLAQTRDMDAAADAAAQLTHRADTMKRRRAASDDDDEHEHHDGDRGRKKRRAAVVEAEENSIGPGAHLGTGVASQAARVARLVDDVAARGAQLHQLRQLLQQKEQEVKSTLQLQHQHEAQHRGEVEVWRAKVEEQSRTHERAAKEARESLEQRDQLLEEANTKLRRLAGMATKYKQVVDTVAALLKRSAGDDARDGKPMTPDDILVALQAKKSL